MDGGIFVNLFEIQLPETLEVYSKPWNNGHIKEISSRMYPINVYGDTINQKLYAFGDLEPGKKIFEEEEFTHDTVTTQQNPQFVGRFAADAVTWFLQTQGFALAKRPYSTYKRELINNKEPLQTFYGSLRIYQAYNVQTMYLNSDGILRYFLIVDPKLRHKITCPAECDVLDCKLHGWRGKIVGRYSGLTDQGFYCEYLQSQDENYSGVALSNARLDFNIPAEVCNLEASLSNIRFVYEEVFDKRKVNELIGRIRVLSGDLLINRSVNLEVGRKRYEDCFSFVQRLSDFEAFGVGLKVVPELLRAIGGLTLPDQDYGFALEDEDDDDFGDVPF